MTAADAIAFRLREVTVSYGGAPVIEDVSLDIPGRGVTALLGASGSGKSTLLRSLNRLNDLIPQASLTGSITFDGQDIHAEDVDLVSLRQRVGMVFQRPTVLPASIRENVMFGPRLAKRTVDDALVRSALTRANLWDDVQGQLDHQASDLSVGQQQRLSIARCLALEPEVLLMDEPTASLDPQATGSIERLIASLAGDIAVVLVTHSLRQAEQVADHVVFLVAEPDVTGHRRGIVVEKGNADQVFHEPRDPRTAEYLRHSP